MGKMSDLAKSCTTGSELLQNRTKVSTSELIAKYPNGITVVGYDIIQGDEPFAAFIFAEESDKFFFGGAVMKDIADTWTEANGTIAAANETLRSEGGVRVRLHRERSKANREYTAVDIL